MVDKKPHFSRATIISRFFWGLMVLGHLPAMVTALLSAEGDHFNLARFFILLLSQTFFVLKLADVRWLRLPNRRASMVFCVVVLLLHAHVAKRLIVGQSSSAEPWQAIVMVGGGGVLAVKSRDEHRRFIEDNPRWARNCDRSAWAVVVEKITTAILPPRFTLLVRACSINRAPPA